MIPRTFPSVCFSLLAVAGLLAACSGSSGPAEPTPTPTVRERCEAACSADGEHPCAGQAPDQTQCVGACEGKLSGKSDDCAQCYFSFAGLRGTACECSSVETGVGSADLACEECTYIGTQRTCETQLINKCNANARTCEGYQDIDLASTYCAARCGLPVNPATDTCSQACARPFSNEHPCNQADSAKVDACQSACKAAIDGKSDACRQCYLAKSYWLGSTCDCDSDGSDCEVCNYAANRGGTSKRCAEVDYRCGELPQCMGWQSNENDCAAECGGGDADAGVDAGSDAGVDAGGEPADAGEQDASAGDAAADAP